MSEGYLYQIHGLALASEVELPLNRLSLRPPDVTYHVALGAPPLPASGHSRADDPDDPWAIEHWVDGRLAVEFSGWATFELSRDEVVLLTDDTEDPDLVVHLLLDHVLPRVVALRGDLMLHAAGAVGPSGRAHLFLGDTGAGKSTLATALATRGWPLLDDDGIRVTGSDGALVAVPGTPNVRLLPDAASVVLPAAPPGLPLSHDSPKRRFDADGRQLCLAAEPAPIAGVYLLQRPGTASMQRLDLADALAAIAAHGFHFAAEPTEITRQVFERASALAAATPVWRLLHPEGLENLDATVALVTEADERS